jgi:hypothetical protein
LVAALIIPELVVVALVAQVKVVTIAGQVLVVRPIYPDGASPQAKLTRLRPCSVFPAAVVVAVTLPVFITRVAITPVPEVLVTEVRVQTVWPTLVVVRAVVARATALLRQAVQVFSLSATSTYHKDFYDTFCSSTRRRCHASHRC